MTDLTEEIAREIAMGREANQPDRITAAKIIEIFKRWEATSRDTPRGRS